MEALIELPDNAVEFKSKQDLDDYFRNERESLYDTPDKYPCIGWNIGYMYNMNGPDEVVWTFVYPVQPTSEEALYLDWKNKIDKIIKLELAGK